MYRRRLLAAGLAGATGALAGCSDSANRAPDTSTDDQELRQPVHEYGLDLSVGTSVDLRDLPADDRERFEQIDEIRDDHYLLVQANVYGVPDSEEEAIDDIEPELTVGRDPVEYEAVDHLFEDTDDVYHIPCTALSIGDNSVRATAEVDGERLEDTATAYKRLPEHDVQLLDPGQQPDDVTDTPYRFHVYDRPSHERHRELRDEYVDYIAAGGDFDATEFVDEHVDGIETDGDVPDTISSITTHWFDEARTYDIRQSLRSEKLGATLEYAFREHLEPDVQAGSVGNHDRDTNGTHDTVVARNPETENLWHVEADASAATVEPYRAGVLREDRFVSGLDVEEALAEGVREHAERTATAFTRTEAPGSGLREKLVHTDEALEDVVTLVREDGDFGTVAEEQIDATMLATEHEHLQFVLDRASETGDAEADLEIRARQR